MKRRVAEALAVLAFPLAVLAVGWMQPVPFAADGGGPPVVVDVAIMLAGALASLALVAVSRRLAARDDGHRGPHSAAVGWLLAGWPLPFPRRGEPDVPVSGMPEPMRPTETVKHHY
jgi:hypothetical protein